MTITFKSKTKVGDKENEIKFDAQVIISNWNGFTVYEFKEPSIGEMNRIEVKEEEINIIAGHNTLNLSLGEKIQNEYVIKGQGTMWLQTQLHEVDIVNDKDVKFSYSLLQNDEEISSFNISLKISENS